MVILIVINIVFSYLWRYFMTFLIIIYLQYTLYQNCGFYFFAERSSFWLEEIINEQQSEAVNKVDDRSEFAYKKGSR